MTLHIFGEFMEPRGARARQHSEGCFGACLEGAIMEDRTRGHHIGVANSTPAANLRLVFRHRGGRDLGLGKPRKGVIMYESGRVIEIAIGKSDGELRIYSNI